MKLCNATTKSVLSYELEVVAVTQNKKRNVVEIGFLNSVTGECEDTGDYRQIIRLT